MRLGAFLLVLLAATPAIAQGPAPVDAGAGAGESAYGCVESVPKGATRPTLTDTFPTRGTSGYAATLSVTVKHGKGEKVLPSGLDLSGYELRTIDIRGSAEPLAVRVVPQQAGFEPHLLAKPSAA